MKRRLLTVAILLALHSASALAQSNTEAWTKSFPQILEEVQAGHPLLTVVVVPLCSNQQINCGASWAGQPGRLETNIYWGAIWGAQRYLQRQNSPWETVQVEGPKDGLLQQIVLRRRVSGSLWGRQDQVEQLVVLQAVHGAEIDGAIDRFWSYATQGGILRFQDNNQTREERIQIVGYNGHNRLMDGKQLPAEGRSPSAIPSFVMACVSESYFAPKLRAAGSTPLLMTRTLMAPEGYLLDAILRSLGENGSRAQIRDAAIAAELKWLKIPLSQAQYMFPLN